MTGQDFSATLLEQVNQALADERPLYFQGTGSKAWLGRPVAGAPLDITGHHGIVHYDHSELVVTVRAGTSVRALTTLLAEHDQMLPFEPPLFGGDASVGGMVATGLAGPRRPWVGSVRDFILGTRIITGEGKHLRFGGEVMKNVAGYDLSRLMAGSFGALGLITEVSFKVLPRPRRCASLQLSMDQATALEMLIRWRHAGLPLTAASHRDGQLRLRLEGNDSSVRQAAEQIGGEALDESHWSHLRDHQLPFFSDTRPLWRLSLPADAPVIDLPGDTLVDWAGAQRWLKSDARAEDIRALATHHGGSAICYRPGPGVEPFHPLPEPLHRYHKALKAKLDPHNIFNPGRLYPDL